MRLLLALLLVACGGASAAPEAPLATEPIPEGSVVSTYGFALAPIDGWTLVGGEQALSLWDAPAGARRQTGVFATVHVEALEGVTLEQAAGLILEGSNVEDLQVAERTRTELAGQPALRMLVTGRLRSVPFRGLYTLALSRGHLYTLLSWSSRPEITAAQLAEFNASFRWVDGPVRRPEQAGSSDQIGPTWRLAGNRFESLSSGLSVVADDPWILLVGDQARELNPEADVMFSSVEPDVYGLLLSEQAPPSRHAQVAQTVRAEVARSGGERLREGTLPFAGEPIPTVVYLRQGLELHHGVRCRDNTCTQLMVWYPAGSREAAEARIRSSLPRIARLSASERSALVAALAEHASSRHEVEGAQAIHGTRVLDFFHGLDLRLPEGSTWQVEIGSAARATGDAARLVFHEPSLGLEGLLVVEHLSSPTSPASYHAASRAVAQLPAAEPTTARLGQLEALISEGDQPGGLRFRMVTALAQNRAYRLVLWSWPEIFDAAGPTMDALASAIELTGSPSPAFELAGGRFVSHRFGYTLDVPGEGWQHVDQTPPHLRERGALHGLQNPGHESIVVVMGIDSATTSAASEALLEQVIRAMGDPLSESPTTLGGLPARHVVLDANGTRLSVVLAMRGRVVVGLLVAGTDIEPFRRSFAFQ